MSKWTSSADRPAIEGGTPVRRQFLPFHRPSIGTDEEKLVLEVLRSGWLTRGQRTTDFEARLREFTGARHALALNSCTAALELALILAGVGPEDEVITTALTFAASANVIAHRLARPVLVDVEPDTLNIDPGAAAQAITPRTRGVIAVDFGGHPAEYDRLLSMTQQHGVVLVRDAAHALEARYRGQPVGATTDYSCLSFYANKNLTTGEGGALLFNRDEKIAERAAILSLHGMSRHAWSRYSSAGFKHYDVTEPGYKWNMFDIQAAIGLGQLARLKPALRRRARIVARYEEALADHSSVAFLSRRPHVQTAYHLFMIQIAPETLRVTRDRLLDALQAEGIGVAVHYVVLPQMSYYRERLGYSLADFPVASAASQRLISLPLFPVMTDRDVDDSVTALRKVLDYYQA
jgi:dTDP-4-amino-4,6-dideoxygalactose transaminase